MANTYAKSLPFLERGVTQIAFVVEDLEKTVRNYIEYFGIKPWHVYTYGKPMVKNMSTYGKPSNYKVRVALSYLGPTRVELIQPLEGKEVYTDFIKSHGYGLHHIGILTDNMDRDLRLAEDRGIDMIMDGSGFGPDGDGHYAYLDTEKIIGITLELIERPKRRCPPEKIIPDEESPQNIT